MEKAPFGLVIAAMPDEELSENSEEGIHEGLGDGDDPSNGAGKGECIDRDGENKANPVHNGDDQNVDSQERLARFAVMSEKERRFAERRERDLEKRKEKRHIESERKQRKRERDKVRREELNAHKRKREELIAAGIEVPPLPPSAAALAAAEALTAEAQRGEGIIDGSEGRGKRTKKASLLMADPDFIDHRQAAEESLKRERVLDALERGKHGSKFDDHVRRMEDTERMMQTIRNRKEAEKRLRAERHGEQLRIWRIKREEEERRKLARLEVMERKRQMREAEEALRRRRREEEELARERRKRELAELHLQREKEKVAAMMMRERERTERLIMAEEERYTKLVIREADRLEKRALLHSRQEARIANDFQAYQATGGGPERSPAFDTHRQRTLPEVEDWMDLPSVEAEIPEACIPKLRANLANLVVKRPEVADIVDFVGAWGAMLDFRKDLSALISQVDSDNDNNNDYRTAETTPPVSPHLSEEAGLHNESMKQAGSVSVLNPCASSRSSSSSQQCVMVMVRATGINTSLPSSQLREKIRRMKWGHTRTVRRNELRRSIIAEEGYILPPGQRWAGCSSSSSSSSSGGVGMGVSVGIGNMGSPGSNSCRNAGTGAYNGGTTTTSSSSSSSSSRKHYSSGGSTSTVNQSAVTANAAVAVAAAKALAGSVPSTISDASAAVAATAVARKAERKCIYIPLLYIESDDEEGAGAGAGAGAGGVGVGVSVGSTTVSLQDFMSDGGGPVAEGDVHVLAFSPEEEEAEGEDDKSEGSSDGDIHSIEDGLGNKETKRMQRLRNHLLGIFPNGFNGPNSQKINGQLRTSSYGKSAYEHGSNLDIDKVQIDQRGGTRTGTGTDIGGGCRMYRGRYVGNDRRGNVPT